MAHRVYMRDWYYNAGIVGFMIALCDGKDLEDVVNEGHISIGDNYIDIYESAFDGFEKKFVKRLFLLFFDIGYFKRKIEGYIKAVSAQQEKNKELIDKNKKPKDPLKTSLKELEDEKKDIYKFFKIMDFKYNTDDADKFISDLKNASEYLSEKTNIGIYSEIEDKKGSGITYIEDYINIRIKKSIFDYSKINEYIKSANKEQKKKLKLNDICLSCQEEDRKAEHDFNNSISNIIGFNKRNTNWVWAFKNTNLRLCGVCAFIYSCALVSFAYVNKKVGDDYLYSLYFLNYNTLIKNMYEKVLAFKNSLSMIDENRKPFIRMIKETIDIIMKEHSKNVTENINFIEIMENKILGGQSSKGYNVYNYNIDYKLAEFLNKKLEKLPKGYYKNKKAYFDIADELITNVITGKLNYNEINKYLTIYISNNSFEAKFSHNSVTKFIFDFIEHMKGGSMNNIKEKIYKRAFRNGKELRTSLINKNKKNQIDGIVFRLLNDLKISDRDKFLDKYNRLVIGNGLFLSFGKEEMNDTECFLHFGYSFVNGLLSHNKEDDNDKNN